jgi:hypothetical protein
VCSFARFLFRLTPFSSSRHGRSDSCAELASPLEVENQPLNACILIISSLYVLLSTCGRFASRPRLRTAHPGEHDRSIRRLAKGAWSG